MPNTLISSSLQYSVGNTLNLFRTYSLTDNVLDKNYVKLDLVLPALITNFAVDTCDIATIGMIFMETTGAVTVLFNTADVVPITVNTFLFMTTSINVTGTTGIYLTNTLNVPVTVKITVLGI